MAGQAQRGSRGRERSSRRASSWPAAGAAGSLTIGRFAGRDPASRSLPPSSPTTRAAYRSLLLRGLAPDEAANLTAYLCGIPVADQRWGLDEINRLLFLRELNRIGRFHEVEAAAH